MTHVTTILAEISQKLGAIGKNSKNPDQGWRYRSIDDLVNTIGPLLAEHGIIIAPTHSTTQRYETRTKSNRAATEIFVTVTYTIYGPDGQTITTQVCGQGWDTGDKALMKGYTYAYKTLLTQLFGVRTEDMSDPDHEIHERGTPPASLADSTIGRLRDLLASNPSAEYMKTVREKVHASMASRPHEFTDPQRALIHKLLNSHR